MLETPTVRIDLQPIGRRAEVPAGSTLLEAAQAAGVELAAVCGGEGICGKCRVRLVAGELTPPADCEHEWLDDAELADGLRLACAARACSDVRVDIPPEALTAAQRLQVEGDDTPLTPDGLDGRQPGALGLAVDVGTTKIAAFLVDLASGATLAHAAAPNPQVAYGEDVVSRIAFVTQRADGTRQLQGRLVERLNELVDELCRAAVVARERVCAAVLVGNTAMHHLLLGLPVAQLGQAPYAPAVRDALDLPADEIGLRLAPGAQLYLPPNIAGYVGGDHIAMLLATGAHRAARPTLAIDIGTNTEISLALGGRLLSCSCASGPTFEGAHIRDGMRAAPGAIERVQIHGGAPRVQTIGGAAAVGICGSGILDAVAELRRAGLITPAGRLRRDGPGVLDGAGGVRYELVAAALAGNGRAIEVTRGDIHEVQLAKGAIRAGIEALLASAGLPAAAVADVIVAGAFGTYLDLTSALRVGMFPPLPPDRFRQVGNAAGVGARRLLLSRAERGEAAAIAARAEYVELTTYAGFVDLFTQSLLLE